MEALADRTGVDVPGKGDTRDNRVSGLGPLMGLAAGVGVGIALGAARSAGLRPPVAVTGALAAAGALVGSNGPMAALGVANPATFSLKAWVTDIVPHLAYGAVTAPVLVELARDGHRR